MQNKESKYEYDVRHVYFDANDEKQLECILLMDKCPRKFGKLLGILAHEFIKAGDIDLETLDKKDLANFISSYKDIPYANLSTGLPFPSSFYSRKRDGFRQDNYSPASQSNNGTVALVNNSNDASKEDKEAIDNALALFGC